MSPPTAACSGATRTARSFNCDCLAPPAARTHYEKRGLTQPGVFYLILRISLTNAHPSLYLHPESHAGIFASHYVIAAVFDRLVVVVAELGVSVDGFGDSPLPSLASAVALQTSLDRDSCSDKHLLSQFRCSASSFWPHRLQIDGWVHRQQIDDARLTAS